MDQAVAARHVLERGPASPILADVDRDLRAAGETLRVELAEETVAALYDGLFDPGAHTDVTVWVGRPLATTASAVPDSYFGEFAADDGRYDAYEVVDEAATLTFVFGRRYGETVEVVTGYDRLEVGFPTPNAFDGAETATERDVSRSG
ncbi:hypothetical protein [Halorarum salinum]|uniref:Uncharacterized protein n=1 Tax=Halorarum salinum TaxID=2743089 RepID=A0A7D5QA23_9EURY|nr:hypothetical protein [Halobaculum salinum]QLG61418.1 hypothetical protein HUG12_06585 [Halobaculum salinum]